MWCDNCLLIFPLRHGAMALATLIVLYNLAGAIFIFKLPDILFFNYPDSQIFGGIGMAVASICIITLIAFSSQSYMLIRLLFFIWPILLIVTAVRMGVMLFLLNRNKTNICWECDHGRVGYTSDAENASLNGTLVTDSTYVGNRIPAVFCNAGFNSLYQYFMTWRLKTKTEHRYREVALKGGIYGP